MFGGAINIIYTFLLTTYNIVSLNACTSVLQWLERKTFDKVLNTKQTDIFSNLYYIL